MRIFKKEIDGQQTTNPGSPVNTKQDKYQKPTGTHFILKLQVTKDKEKKLNQKKK